MPLPLLAIAAIGTGVASIGASVLHTQQVSRDPSRIIPKRRGAANYAPTSFHYGVPEPLRPLNTLPPLVNLNTLKPLTTLTTLKPLDSVIPSGWGKKNAEFNEFTDPLQVNSFSDVLFNQAGKDIIINDLGLNWLNKIPVAGDVAKTIVVGADALINKVAAPTIQGDFTKTFMFGLNALGEDLDYIDFANTVKGGVLEKDKSKVLSRSLGIGNEGKYTYNYNTGNGWKDFGAEVVSSPGTYILLIKGVLVGGVKTAFKQLGETILDKTLKETGIEFTEAQTKQVVKQVTNAQMRGVLKGIDPQKELTSILNNAKLKHLESVLANSNAVEFEKNFMKNYTSMTLGNIGASTVGALKVFNTLDNVNDALSMFALKSYFTGGTYPVIHTVKKNMNTQNLFLKKMQKAKELITRTTNSHLDEFADVSIDSIKTFDNATVKDAQSKLMENAIITGEAQYGHITPKYVTNEGKLPTEDLINFTQTIFKGKSTDEIFTEVVQHLKETNTNKLNIEELVKQPKFKEYVENIVIPSASEFIALREGLNKAFYVFKNDVDRLLKTKETNAEALLGIEEYFAEEGTTLARVLSSLRKSVLDPIKGLEDEYKDLLVYFEGTLKKLNITEDMLTTNSMFVDTILTALKNPKPGETVDAILETVGATIKQAVKDASIEKEIIDPVNTAWTKSRNWVTLKLDTLIKALEDGTVKNDAIKIFDSLNDPKLTGDPEDFLKAVQMLEDKGVQSKRLEGLIDYTMEAEAKYRAEMGDIVDINAPITSVKELEETAFDKSIKISGSAKKEIGDSKIQLEIINKLRKASKKPSTLYNVTAEEAAHAITKIKIPSGEKMLQHLIDKGVAFDITEAIPAAELKHILNSSGNVFTKIKNGFKTLDLLKGDPEDVLYAGFEANVSNMPKILELKQELEFILSKDKRLTKNNVIAYLQTANDLADEVTEAIANYSKAIEKGMIDRGEKVFSKDFNDYYTKTNPVLETLRDLESYLGENITPMTHYVELKANAGKIYMFKMSQFAASMKIQQALMETTFDGMPIMDVILDIANKKGSKTMLGSLVNIIRQIKTSDATSVVVEAAAQRIYTKSKSIELYNILLDSVDKLKFEGEGYNNLNSVLFEVIEKYRSGSINVIKNKLTDKQLSKEILTYLDAPLKTGTAKLEKQYSDLGKTLPKGLKAHDANTDIAMNIEVFEKQLHSAEFEKYYNEDPELYNEIITGKRDFVVFDTETTGLSEKGARVGDELVIQIAAVRYRYINGVRTEIGRINSIGNNVGKRIPEVVSDNVKKLSPLSKKSSVDLEDELKALIQSKPDNLPVLVGHNVEAFDIPFLQNRVPMLSACKVYDTYQALLETTYKSPILQGANEAAFARYVNEATKILRSYATLKSDITPKGRFLDTMDRQFADDLFEFGNGLSTFIKQMDTSTDVNQLLKNKTDNLYSMLLGKGKSAKDYNAKVGEGNVIENAHAGTSFSDAIRNVLTELSLEHKQLNKYGMYAKGSSEVAGLENKLGTPNPMAYMYGYDLDLHKYTNDPILSDIAIKKIYDDSITSILNKKTINQNIFEPGSLVKWERNLSDTYENLAVATSMAFRTADVDKMRAMLLEDFKGHSLMQLVDVEQSSIYQMFALYKTMAYRESIDPKNLNAVDSLIQHGAINQKLDIIENLEGLQHAYDALEDASLSVEQQKEAYQFILSVDGDVAKNRLIMSLAGDFQRYGKDPSSLDINFIAELKRTEFKDAYPLFNGLRELANLTKNFSAHDKAQWREIQKNILHNNTLSILTASPQDLVRFMRKNMPVTQLRDADLDTYLDLIHGITMRKSEYEAVGIGIKAPFDDVGNPSATDLDSFTLYLTQDAYKNVTKNEEKSPFTLKYKATLDKNTLNPNVLEAYNRLEASYEQIARMNGVENHFDMYNGNVNTLSASQFYAFRKTLPKEVINNMVDDDVLMKFFLNNSKIDYTVLGSASARRSANQYVVTDVVNSHINALTQRVKLGEAKNKYLELINNSDSSMKTNEFYKNMTHTDLLKVFDKQYGMTAIVTYTKLDKKTGKMKTFARSITPKNAAQIAQLKELNAIPMPADYANKVVGTINDFAGAMKESHPYIYMWREYVMSAYKSIFLSSTGFLFRNMMDIIVKNTASMNNGPGGVLDTLKYNMAGFRMWQNYSKVLKEIVDQDHGITSYGIEAYFRKNVNSIMHKADFDFVHEYTQSAASSGMAKAQQDLVMAFNKDRKGIKSNIVKQVAFENPAIKLVMGGNSYIEHSGRLGLMLQSLDEGVTKTEALKRVLGTHFDYSNLSQAELIAEFFIPFVTFPLRNLEYWSKTVEGNMWMVRNMVDSTMYSNGMLSRDQSELDNNYEFRSSIANGNVNIFGHVLKTNPSMFDAAKLVMDPIGEFNNRLAPPIKQILKGSAQLNPVQLDGKAIHIVIPPALRALYARRNIDAEFVEGIDGDTVILNYDGKERKVRILGLDTSELGHSKGEDELGSVEASAYLKERFANAKSIVIKYDPRASNKEYYGRELAHVYLDGKLFALDVINEGHSVALPVHTKKYVQGQMVNTHISKLEQTANDWGLYNFTRFANYAKTAFDLAKGEGTDTWVLLPPSLFGNLTEQPGNRTGDISIWKKFKDGTSLELISQTKRIPEPKEKPKQEKEKMSWSLSESTPTKISPRAAYSTQRSPGTRAYYKSGITTGNTNLPISTESLDAIKALQDPRSIYYR